MVALGTPLGLQNTVTRGIVSAVREVGGLTLVQTDAAINPGNSGGPLLDRAGQVIGITTLGVKSADAQGLAFAVAIEHAQALLAGKRATDRDEARRCRPLNEAMSGQRGAAGDRRAAASAPRRAYEQAIAAQAQRADALDERLAQLQAHLLPGAIVGTVRPRVVRALGPARDAGRGAARLRQRRSATSAAPPTRSATRVLAAGEAARQADVYPGHAPRRAAALPPRTTPGWDRRLIRRPSAQPACQPSLSMM